ncbi:MAG: hypothetical protein M3186_05990, partial [Actinomycetota bacterium]|nr:hypothetical protein [Actinomycetota bacterium]
MSVRVQNSDPLDTSGQSTPATSATTSALVDRPRHRGNILLVHGGFADGSIWMPVIKNLQRKNFNVVASQMPLTSFKDDVKAVRRDL